MTATGLAIGLAQKRKACEALIQAYDPSRATSETTEAFQGCRESLEPVEVGSAEFWIFLVVFIAIGAACAALIWEGIAEKVRGWT